MATYNDFTQILESFNFIGGAGQSQIPNSGNDVRAEVLKDGSDVYQFYYKILSGLSDLNSLGYYSLSDREYTQLPNGNDPAVISVNQLSIFDLAPKNRSMF